MSSRRRADWVSVRGRRGPALDLVDVDEAGLDAVGDVVEGIGGVVGPVHDETLDGPEPVARLARTEGRGKAAARRDKAEERRLIGVEEVIPLLGHLAEERLVFQDAVHEGAGRIHSPVGAEKDRREDAEGLGVALEPSVGLHEPVEGALTGVAEGRMPDVVGQADRLDQIRIDPVVGPEERRSAVEPVAEAPADLGDLDRVGQPGAVEVVFPAEKDLGLVLETAEGGRVDDAVAVDLEGAAVLARPRRLGSLEPFFVKLAVKLVHGRPSPGEIPGPRHRDSALSAQIDRAQAHFDRTVRK